MSYQVIARRFRPKCFKEVVGQEGVVATLRGALHLDRIAQAYLFCGSRGTGKTTLARLFAKALNCKERSKEGEPCNGCPSCRDIAAGTSLDVIEIDGASHRGIEDIRQINEAVHFAPSQGQFKIYLIDEVHMLTKEAFNALLKTIEEPPPHVKFFFATTEAHKIPHTILSRCQRLNLSRIESGKIVQKLDEIGKTLELKLEKQALELIARLASGSLRDAESLFDQVIAYSDEKIEEKQVRDVFGLPSEELFIRLDHGKGEYQIAFEIAEEIFSSGKHIGYFLQELIAHFRHLLLAKRGVGSHPSQDLYHQEQLLDLLELIGTGTQTIKTAPSERVHLEMLLLQVLRSHERVSFESLVKRLEQLEGGEHSPSSPPPIKPRSTPTQPPPPRPNPTPKVQPKQKLSEIPSKQLDTLTRFAAKELGGTLK
ncbi:MAG: DNA polymerase III subunit tau [Chlamydiales bacterium]|nr:DNA polymerase III subunit tau [Chlamydiales bacterium]MCH9619945.1 DNA polymerase III subunit tau [Chlamydiales bacterium]MCH9622628.1 DNA polymerase III subunit tau [Chlamydiales bacterium]